MAKSTPPSASKDSQVDFNKLACAAWAIHGVLTTLHAALPEDAAGCAVPIRCVLQHVIDEADALASVLMEVDLA